MAEATIDKHLSDEPEFGDFFALLKPRVMSLVVFTAIAGVFSGSWGNPSICSFCINFIYRAGWWCFWCFKYVV